MREAECPYGGSRKALMREAERPLWGKQKGSYEGSRKALMREAERKKLDER